MLNKDNRSLCRNCRIGLPCSNCGINHNDARPDFWPSVDVAPIPGNKDPKIIGMATRDICKCDRIVIVQL